MPAPTFNLPVYGTAPDQYATEASFEASINAVLGGEAAMVDDQRLVAHSQGRHPMGHDDERHLALDRLEGLADGLF